MGQRWTVAADPQKKMKIQLLIFLLYDYYLLLLLLITPVCYVVLLTVGPSVHTTAYLFTHLYIIIGYSLAYSCLLFDYYYYNCRAIIPVILVIILLCYY